MTRMYDLKAPAKLFYWPAEDGAEEEAVYPTLQDALRAAAEGDLASAWIVTQAGDILNPRVIAELRLDIVSRGRERRSGPLGFLGWSAQA
jgi:hypothetical protein